VSLAVLVAGLLVELAALLQQASRASTTENSGVVILTGDWVYSVQVSIKFTYIPQAASGQQGTVQKIRIQASGHLAKISKGRLKEAFQGYDSVVLQNVFQDLQAKLGPR
jgi:hypothetical protein